MQTIADVVGELSLDGEGGDGATVGPGLQPVKNKKPSKAQKRRVGKNLSKLEFKPGKQWQIKRL